MEQSPQSFSGFYSFRWGSTRPACWILLLGFLIRVLVTSADTNPQDAAALESLTSQWQNTPSNWIGSDPCGSNWVGIKCAKSRIVSMDLSYNKGLTGQLPASIGRLSRLINLILVGCSFYGQLPDEIGSLSRLVFLPLNSNGFTGNIPPTIGNLSKLYWLDLGGNELTGSIPVSDGTTPGLDLLTHTKHFHFGINQLSGAIASKLFSSNMQLIHALFDNNNFSGSIPCTLGLVTTLEVLRLDMNSLTGPVPTNLNNLTRVAELHLANNKLTGLLPDLTGMNALNFVDMSNNSFDASDIPRWFASLPSLTTLRLRNNRFNGTLNISSDYSNQLELIDLQNNQISAIIYAFVLCGRLVGNPVCKNGGINLPYCNTLQNSAPSYSTPKNCVTLPPTCSSDQSLSSNCNCAFPYMGTLYFRSPSFSDLGNTTYYLTLEQALQKSFTINQLPVDSVSLSHPFVDSSNNLEMSLQVFPSSKIRFSESDVTGVGFILSNQTFKPPTIFGPYYFVGQEYPPFTGKRRICEIFTSHYAVLHAVPAPAPTPNHLPIIVGATIGGVALLVTLIILGVFVIKRRKQTKRSEDARSRSYVSWDPSKSSGSIPQLKGARLFSFEELKKCTNNFSEANEIGNGGYGKVYRGTLSNGQLIAVKRAEQGSMQGESEFKTEIELLSRVHHKNLVSLVGFCFDQGEQMLVYEHVPNGTLKESLSGKSGVRLDWKRRLRVALGAARGLTYLHELANPPIVHRDIKSSNILLHEHLNAKVSDFGLSKSLGDDARGHITTQVKGTMGYLDPEYYMTQQLTEKSDVYSFGVLLLEIITAKKPLEPGRYVVREVNAMMDKSKDLYSLHELLDPALGLGAALGGFERYVDLAMMCVGESGLDRPKMSEVVNEVEKIMQMAGMNPNAGSASTSMSYYAETSKSPIRHPYSNEGSFDYSGGAPSPKLEPK
ncbi:putative leucine-rich repeat receptor-like protein kinase [Ananas comosus]|uniref:non-specific serine/threonine protein kinase n=1 Tax=Ananas comosus TaxID=4615 RepID=A0A199UGK7_ANACO|nr:putative leucine-rich repeat receptor-like protein kinase [Ananas comosus]